MREFLVEKIRQMAKALTVGFVVSVGFVGCSDHATPKPESFTIESKRNDDIVDVQSDTNRTTFSIRSPFGISQAIIKRSDDTWPKSIVLKLHLSGLEKFCVSNNQFAINASVSSHEMPPTIRVWKDDQETEPLQTESPYWIDIQIVEEGQKKGTKIPLHDGCFEVKLPSSLVDGNPPSIEVQWIDFYRG